MTMALAPHVVIVGGGIGGLALAQGLKKAGIRFDVYERDHATISREQGYRLHIDSNGSQALYECLPDALWQTFYATAGDTGNDIGFLTEQLRTMLLIENEFAPLDVGDVATFHHAASRLTLRQILLAGLGDNVHFGKKFVRYEQTGEKVRVYFAGGANVECDVLIGADGANSKVRRQLIPHAKREKSGAIGVGGKFDLTAASRLWLPDRIQNGMHIILGPQDFLFTSVFQRRQQPDDAIDLLGENLKGLGVDPTLLMNSLEDRDYVLWAFVTRDEPNLVESSGTDLKRQVRHLCADWHPNLLRMMEETQSDTVNAFSFLTASPVRPWETSRVTLMGDAIHSMTPVGGMGANTALRDARLLYHKLLRVHRGEEPLLVSLQEYEQAMLEYGFSAVEASLRNTRHAIERPFARRMSRSFLRTCQAIAPLKRVVFDGR